MAKKYSDDKRRLIILLLLTLFFLAFILVNVTYKSGLVFLIMSMVSLVITIFWDEIPKKRPERKIFALQKDWIGDLFFGIIVGGLVLVAMNIVPALTIGVPSLPSSTAFPEAIASAGQFLTVVVSAPLVEEVAFRSILFAILWTVIGISFFWSSFFSSIVFSLFHIEVYAGELAFNPILAVANAFISAFLIAMVFCYVNKWRGSVTSSMGAHGTINAGIVSPMIIAT